MATFGGCENKVWELCGSVGGYEYVHSVLDENEIENLLSMRCSRYGEELRDICAYQLDCPEIRLPEQCEYQNGSYVEIEYIQNYVRATIIFDGDDRDNLNATIASFADYLRS